MRISQRSDARVRAQIAEVRARITALGVDKLRRMDESESLADPAVEIRRVSGVDRRLGMCLRLSITTEKILRRSGVNDKHVNAVRRIDSDKSSIARRSHIISITGHAAAALRKT